MYRNLEKWLDTVPLVPITVQVVDALLLNYWSLPFFFNLCDGVPYHKYMLCGSNRNAVLGMFDCYKTNVIDDSYCYYEEISNYY